MAKSDEKHQALMAELSMAILQYGAGSDQAFEARNRVELHNRERATEARQLRQIAEENDLMSKAEMTVDKLADDLRKMSIRNKALEETIKTQQTALLDQMNVTSEPKAPDVEPEPAPTLPEIEKDQYGRPIFSKDTKFDEYGRYKFDQGDE